MLLNASVTAFTLSELLRENQQGRREGGRVKLHFPTTEIRVNGWFLQNAVWKA